MCLRIPRFCKLKFWGGRLYCCKNRQVVSRRTFCTEGSPETTAVTLMSYVHTHHNYRSLSFSSKPSFSCSSLITPTPPPPNSMSLNTPGLNMSFLHSWPNHTHYTQHQVMSSWVRSLPHFVSYVHWQAYEPTPPLTNTALFSSTWSFIVTGYPEHFTFPSVVQQMCSRSRELKGQKKAEVEVLSVGQWKCSNLPVHIPAFFLFSSC